MKKIILFVAAALILAAPTAMAQKIKVETYQSKIDKSEEAIQNEKKAAKAATWITRGNVYLEALQAPTTTLFTAMDVAMMKLTNGEPTSVGSEEIKGVTYETLIYPFFTVYTTAGKVAGWKVTKQINDNATALAFESYSKAYDMDPAQLSKVKSGLESLANYYAQIGDISNTLSDYNTGAEAYIAVYDIQNHPAYNIASPMMLYYAGYMYTLASNDDPSFFAKGVDALERALAAGYAQEELKDTELSDSDKGNIFYYLYHCYYGQREDDAANLQSAKATLVKGVEMFPKNQRILDALTQLYTTEEGIGDPAELVSMIDTAIAADPTNADLWFARGRVFFSLEDYDNCIASFEKVTELAPTSYDGFFYLGLFYIYKGDALNEEVSAKSYTENAAYMADMQVITSVYSAAIAPLEKAFELRPTDVAAVEYLKSLCFRLRDEEGLMDKYTKYNALFNELKGQE